MDCYFKKDQMGRLVFFTWGYLGRGRVLENPEAADKLRAALKKHALVWSGIVFGMLVFQRGHYWLGMAGALGMYVSYGIACGRLLAGRPESNEELTFREFHSVLAAKVGAFKLGFSMLFSALFAGGGCWMVFTERSVADKLTGGLCALIFSFIFFNSIYLQRLRGELEKKPG
jgi:hypothetical protein